MQKVFKMVYAIYGMLVFASIMVCMFPFVIFFSFLGRTGYVFSFYLVKLWALLYAILTFTYIKIKRSGKVKRGKSYIFVSNHTSLLDTIAIVLAVPGAIRPLGKKELKKIPLLGIVISRFSVFVDRKNKESRRESLQNMIKVAECGDNMLIFPEGTMNRTGDKLQDFYDGAFKIAKETNLDVVPVVIKNAHRLLPPSRVSLRPGVVSVEVGEPILQSVHSVESLKEGSRSWICNRL